MYELNCTEKVYSYDGDKLISYDGQSCVYNDMGRPTTYLGKAVTWSAIGKIASFNSATYEYDTNGRRLKANAYSFIYDGDGNIISRNDGPDFFYDHAGVACMTYRGTTQVWYRRDAQGNVIALVENGNVVARYVYDAWGNHRVLDANYNEITDTSHIGHINPLRYRGYYYDVETGLYYCNARYYDPTTGRFISPDSIEYLDPETINGLNLFSYCGNNPVMNVDPSGHIFWTMLIGAIIGAVIGAGIGFGTVVYTDYQDDGQIFNGSVKWYEYIGGTATGAVIGAGVGGIIGAGGAVLASAMSSVTNKFISDLFAYTLTGTPFGTWEDYAVAFISGGLAKGLGMKGIVKTAYDVALRPAINQAVKIGTNRTETFNVKKYAYDVVTRGLTTFAPSPWKAFYRGGFRSMWDIYKREYFA